MRVLGHELKNAGAHARQRARQSIGFIFQSHNLLASLTALENVQLRLELDLGLSSETARSRSLEMLEEIGLGDCTWTVVTHELSGGQKQRVAIARALVHRPAIVLADEPTAALDKQTGREVVDILRRLAKQHGCSILFVTHDTRILDIADRILMLEDGRLGA